MPSFEDFFMQLTRMGFLKSSKYQALIAKDDKYSSGKQKKKQTNLKRIHNLHLIS